MPHRETLNQLRTLKEQATDKSMTSYQASQGIKQALDLASSLPKIKDIEMNVEFASYIK